jgi:lactoylglutathione lyase
MCPLKAEGKKAEDRRTTPPRTPNPEPRTPNPELQTPNPEPMNVERVKYIIWAVDLKRAMRFYRDVFNGEVVRESEVICEVAVSGATIGIHRGGEGGRTWTGLSFQVADVLSGAREVVAGGGCLSREPEPEGSEPPHLAMCVDTEGNEFMLTRKRGR